MSVDPELVIFLLLTSRWRVPQSEFAARAIRSTSLIQMRRSEIWKKWSNFLRRKSAIWWTILRFYSFSSSVWSDPMLWKRFCKMRREESSFVESSWAKRNSSRFHIKITTLKLRQRRAVRILLDTCPSLSESLARFWSTGESAVRFWPRQRALCLPPWIGDAKLSRFLAAQKPPFSGFVYLFLFLFSCFSKGMRCPELPVYPSLPLQLPSSASNGSRTRTTSRLSKTPSNRQLVLGNCSKLRPIRRAASFSFGFQRLLEMPWEWIWFPKVNNKV